MPCGCCRVNSAHSVQGAAAELCSEAESSLGLRPYWGWGSVGLSPHPGLTLISLTALLERHAPLWLHWAPNSNWSILRLTPSPLLWNNMWTVPGGEWQCCWRRWFLNEIQFQILLQFLSAALFQWGRLPWISGGDDDAGEEGGGFQFLMLVSAELVEAKERPCQSQKLTLAQCDYSKSWRMDGDVQIPPK